MFPKRTVSTGVLRSVIERLELVFHFGRIILVFVVVNKFDEQQVSSVKGQPEFYPKGINK